MSNRIVTGIAGVVLAAFALGCGENEGPTESTAAVPLTLSPASIGIQVLTSGTLTALGPDGTSPAVTWESADNAIATVDAEGVVTGVAVGRTAVTARLASDASVIRSATVTITPPPILTKGTTFTGIASPTGVTRRWTLTVPANTTSLTITMSGGTGDADLYVRATNPPDLATFDCRPFRAGNEEECVFVNPVAGTWHVMLDAYEGYTGVSLRANWVP